MWGKCSKLTRKNLPVVKDFELDIKLSGDATKLINEVKGIEHQIESNTSIYDAIYVTKTRYCEYHQEDKESNGKHLQYFNSTMESIEHAGGDISTDTGLAKHEKEKDTEGIQGATNEEYHK